MKKKKKKSNNKPFLFSFPLGDVHREKKSRRKNRKIEIDKVDDGIVGYGDS